MEYRSGNQDKFSIQLPPQAEWILERLTAGGFEAYAVGGCVRDTILGRSPGDWDITTSARPEQVKKLFGKTVDTGLQHGTVTVIRDHVGYEITTYRIDGEYEDGRHPKEVAFTSDLREDLRRRDFTINAMAYNHQTGLVDLFGGLEDLKNRVIRCVGDPAERFTEDALRILRAVRFAAQLGCSIEPETYLALSGIAPNLAHVSKERIQTELTKTLLSGRPQGVFEIEKTGMSPYMTASFSEIFRQAQVQGLDLKLRLEQSAGLPKQKHLRYGAFLSHLGEKKAAALLKELKLDNETIRHTSALVKHLSEPLPQREDTLRLLMSRLEDGQLDDLFLLKKTLLAEQEEAVSQAEELCSFLRKRGDCIRMKDLAVTGNDLIGAGMKPGKEMGEALKKLFHMVLEEPSMNKKEILLSAAFSEKQH